MSHQVALNLDDLNHKAQNSPCPESIHSNPEQLYTMSGEPSIKKRDYQYMGNRENKEYM